MFPHLPTTTDEMGEQASALSRHINQMEWLSGISLEAPALVAIAAAMVNPHLFTWWPSDPEDPDNTEEFLPVMWDDTYVGMLVRNGTHVYFETTTWQHPKAVYAMDLAELLMASEKIEMSIVMSGSEAPDEPDQDQ